MCIRDRAWRGTFSRTGSEEPFERTGEPIDATPAGSRRSAMNIRFNTPIRIHANVDAPTEKNCVFVSWDEWCDIDDSITDDAGHVACGDLIEWADDLERNSGPCNKWDPFNRRWMLLSKDDASYPFESRDRLPLRQRAAQLQHEVAGVQ